ncbi:hypothetical protein PHMEG_00038758 [Phytophthora megakarya]|uniref:Uncharacterized protein n=1 Tax=Phytophthora megakarya TaxID=4795 RepID=A0A225UH74_9STRA|nr:hypothetical protein PHMEG_00038758 [Phytophthora megakarya]
MSDNINNNSSSQQKFSKLQEMMKGGDNEESSYLDSLKIKSTDYDNSHKSSQETATSYFQSAMDQSVRGPVQEVE